MSRKKRRPETKRSGLFDRLRRSRRRRGQHRNRARRLLAEPLEDRRLLSIDLISGADPSLPGSSGDYNSYRPSISADGRYVAFDSYATNLVTGDTNGLLDIFVRDTQTWTTTRVSTDSAGAQGNGASANASISADGRYVAFLSEASNLVPGDTNGRDDVFVKDTQTGTVTRITNHPTGLSTSYWNTPSISADGRYVAFYSEENNLVPGDTNGDADIFVTDTQTGTTTRVSTDSAGAQANGWSWRPSMSSDGRYVAFYSDASNLVPGDTNGGPGSYGYDVFVKDTQTGTTIRVSTDSAGNEGNGYSYSSSSPMISSDGRYVAFHSAASNLVPGDTNGASDVFVKDVQTGTTTRISTDNAGVHGNGDSSSPSISADGCYVAFASVASNLVSGDTNGVRDVFVKDIQTGTTTRISTDSAGVQGNSHSYQPSINSDGQYVAFHSNAYNLHPEDTTSRTDVFRWYVGNDFGDAPAPYPTTRAQYGAMHYATGPLLGANRDSEPDGQPAANANGDDVQTMDDEDGLANATVDLMLTEGTDPAVNVIVTNDTAETATLHGWIDYNADGVFDNITERTSETVAPGTTGDIVTLTFPTVPAGTAGSTYARFRFSTDTANAQHPTGAATDGEVEDYAVTITEPSSGLVKTQQKISDTEGGFDGVLADDEFFGASVANIGDLDGDGISDLVVGAIYDDEGATNAGAVWILFLDNDGTVKDEQKITAGVSGFTGDLDVSDSFGVAVAHLGDLNGDGISDVAVGAQKDDDGNTDRGAVWILFLDSDGTVKEHQKISDWEGGFAGILENGANFGRSVASLGDLDGDGVTDLAVGAHNDPDGGAETGAAWILFLNPNGTVKANQKISATEGDFGGTLDVGGRFGVSLANLGDLNADGIQDLAVGAHFDDDGGTRQGAVWVLNLNRDGTVNDKQKISSLHGNFTGQLDDSDYFGGSLANMGDLDGDGVTDLAVGAWRDDGGTDNGAVWLLNLNGDGTVKSHRKIGRTDGDFGGIIDNGDEFGVGVAALGDLDSDGVPDLAVGAYKDDDSGTDRGAVWIVSLQETVDTGDAPAPYPTNLADGGPYHIASGPMLGASRDQEAVAQPSPNADGDDTAGSDDEDGVTVPSTIMVGQLDASVIVTITGGSGKLDAWIDFNGDGSWGGPGEHIADNVSVDPGANTITFDVPSWAIDGDLYARFRLSTAGNLAPTGPAADGEVEDHRIPVAPPAASTGDFGDEIPIATSSMSTMVRAADLDGDADMDILNVSNASGLTWYENDGSQNFTPSVIHYQGAGCRSVFVADVDGDGDQDLVTGWVGLLMWHENTAGDASAWFHHNIDVGEFWGHPAAVAADLDADGDLDIVGTNHQKVSWWENRSGDGSVWQSHEVRPFVGSVSTTTADIDGDGDVDILATSESADRITLFENVDGNGTSWAERDIATSFDYPYALDAADLDGDGDQDVLGAAYAGAEIAWWENDLGDASSWNHHTIAASYSFPLSVYAADVDGDGDLDVMGASNGNQEITWWENQSGDASNLIQHTLHNNYSARSAYAADVDSDGDLDILGAEWGGSSQVSWWENNQAPTDISLDNSNVPENQPAGTVVGTLSTTDGDVGDTHTYTLVSGAGDTDNGSFAIVGDQLKTAASFDYETKDTYNIRVQTDDGKGGTYEAPFTISVTDVPEGSFGDLVWNDLNRDGIQDAGEPGIEGAVVEVFTAADDVSRGVAITDSSGYYQLDDVPTDLELYVQFRTPVGDRATPVEIVSVAYPGNADDTTGYGGVAESFWIGKYEVTAGQYAAFLNAVAAEDTYGLYNTNMWSDEYGCKIERSGSSGSYTYSVADDRADRPVNFVSWGDAARYSNWLHNGQPTGPQDATTTEAGAYFLNGATSQGDLMAVTRQTDAAWFLPTEDQWYKSAYYNGPGSVYYDYPTGSNSAPSNVVTEPDPGNNANIYAGGYAIGAPYYATEVGEFENSASPFGTYDQGGNLWEWNETAVTSSRVLRGGYYANDAPKLRVSFRNGDSPTHEHHGVGFRVATAHEPGYYFSPKDAGADDTIDSDPGTTGTTETFSLPPGPDDLTLDAGMIGAAPDFGWALGVGDADEDIGQSMVVDAEGNVYVTGGFFGTVDFDSGLGDVSLTSAGERDIFVAKYTQTGALVWARSAGGSSDDNSVGIDVDSDGNAYITGRFRNTATFGSTTLTSDGGSHDVFVAKLDSGGRWQWTKAVGSGSGDIGFGIAVQDGSVWSTGYFVGTVDFDPGSGIDNLTSEGSTEAYVWKLDSDGNHQWAGRIGGPNADYPGGIAVDASGTAYVTGYFAGTATAGSTTLVSNSGSDDVFVAKLDATGGFAWAESAGGSADDAGKAIAVDSAGNAYVTGRFAGAATFGATTLPCQGGHDAFVWKLNSSGTTQWAVSAGSADGDDSGDAIDLGTDGSPYVVGAFRNTVDFDPGATTCNLTSASAAQPDTFVWSLTPAGEFASARSFSGEQKNKPLDVAVGAGDVVYTTGLFEGTVDFDPASASDFELTSAGYRDMFVAKLNPPDPESIADYGDLPADYGMTTRSDDGARHTVGSLFLGTAVDREDEGQESADAGLAADSGDDDAVGMDDEDGITVVGTWQDGSDGGSVLVVVTGGSGYLSGWIDWNSDNDFADPGEQIFNMESVAAGAQTLIFDVPAGAISTSGVQNRFSRFRLGPDPSPALELTGLVMGGEVEDHYLEFTGLVPEVSVAVSPASLNEDDAGTLDFTFTRTGNTNEPLVVNFDTSGSASVADGDFAASHIGNVTIPIGAASVTVQVDPTPDATVELDETVQLTVTAGMGYTISAPVSATGTIENDDSATLTIGNASVAEGDSGATVQGFPVTLSNPVDVDVSVDYRTFDDTAATADGDYVGVGTTTFTIDAGDTSGQIDITVSGDNRVELEETLSVFIANLQAGDRDVESAGPGGAALSTAILETRALASSPFYVGDMDLDGNMDVVVVTSSTQIEIQEWNGTNFVQRFVITDSAGHRRRAVGDVDGDGWPELMTAADIGGQIRIWEADADNTYSLRYSESTSNRADGMAVSDSDGDGAIDFLIQYDASGAHLDRIRATANDSYAHLPDIVPPITSGSMGVSGAADFDGDGAPETVVYTRVGASGTDYVSYIYENDTLTFTQTGIIRSVVYGTDTDGNGLGEFLAQDGSTYTLRESTGSGNSFQDVWSSSDAVLARMVDADNDGRAELFLRPDAATNTFTLSHRSGGSLETYVDSGATFEPWPDGLSSPWYVGESNGVPQIAVYQGGNLHIAALGHMVTGTIENDDSATLSIGDASVVEGDSGTTVLSFPVTLTNPVDVNVSVDYQTFDDTATTADGDYVGIGTTTLTIDAGDTSGQIDITVNGDDRVETDETLLVAVADLQNGGRDVELGLGLQDSQILETRILPAAGGIRAITDMDMDGNMDVVRATSEKTEILEWDGSSFVSRLVVNAASDYNRSPAVGDVDGDGIPELLTVSPISNPTIRVWEADGDNVYSVRYSETLSTPEPESAFVGDTDGDGNNEFVISFAGRLGYNVFLSRLEGTADNTYSHLPQLDGTSPGNGRTAGARDLDGDGAPETTLGANDLSEMYLFENGAIIQTFSEMAQDLGDLDGNGLGEVLLRSGNTVTIQESTGSGDNFASVLSLTDVGGTSIVDIDVDGQDELFIRSATASNTFTLSHRSGSSLVQVFGSGTLFAFSTDAVDAPMALGNDRFAVVQGSSLHILGVGATGTIENDDATPVANAGGPYTIDEGGSLALDASATTDADSTSLTYRWDVDGDGDYDEGVTGETRTVSWAELVALGIDDGPDGPRNITVEVSDGTNIDTATTTFTILNAPPIAEAGPDQTVDEGDAIAFDASGSYDPGPTDTLTFEWDFGDDSTATGPMPTHTYTDNGVFTATVTVTDNDGDSATDTLTVTVNNVAPSLQSVSVSPAIDENGVATLSGVFSDPGTADTHTIVIDWGGGTPEQPAEGTTTITTAGPNPPDTTLTDLGNGSWSFTAQHRYLDDNPTLTPADVYTPIVSLRDDDGGQFRSITEDITRVSVGSSGVEGNGFSGAPAITPNGRFVAFTSWADNLVPGDTSGFSDVFVQDLLTGSIQRVSVDSNGVQGNHDAYAPSISDGGRFVAFMSSANNLVVGDTNGSEDVFVRDRQTGETTRVSVDSSGNEGHLQSFSPSISADGRYVAYATLSNLVPNDTNGISDVFVHDRQTGSTARVSVDSNGNEGDGHSMSCSISANGRFVVFESEAGNLVAGDTNGARDVFVHDRQSGVTRRVSVDSSGAEVDAGSAEPSVSADGHFVVFHSGASNLVAGDTNGASDVFVHDTQTGVTARVSVDSFGNQSSTGSLYPSISPDGRCVGFRSKSSDLVSDDTNGHYDVFVHDRQTGATTRVSVDSHGNEGNNLSDGGISLTTDGGLVAFGSTASNLVSRDTNNQHDVFVHDTTNGKTRRISDEAFFDEGNSDSFAPSVSEDGRYVAYSSSASNLVTGDTNDSEDIFVHDRQTGVTSRLSVNSAGNEADGSSNSAAISADGHLVAFSSYASNLVPGDGNGEEDIFVHDRQTGATTRVSVDAAGNGGDGRSYAPSVSDDGRFVVFESDASNLIDGDANGVTDIFVHDRQTGTTTRVSVDSGGNGGNEASNLASISADGRFVTFSSAASNLVPADSNGAGDVFVHDRQTGTTTRVSLNTNGNEGNADSFYTSISADGRHVAFLSFASNLVSGDTNAASDIFVHDRQTGATTRVSLDSFGNEGNSSSMIGPSISADGRYVAFDSNADNLAVNDNNGLTDAFIHDRQTGATTRLSTDASGIEGDSPSWQPSISADGKYVAFSSFASNLVTGDTNNRWDIFVTTTPLQVTVNNVAPIFEAGPNETLDPPQAGEFTRTITFTDPGALDIHTVEVDWETDGFVDDTITISPLGTRSFDLEHTFTAEGTFTVSVTLEDDDLGSSTDTFQVTVDLNNPPTTSDNTVATNEDTTYTFASAEFNFSDPDVGDTLQAVEITTLPGVGTLYLDLDDNNVNDGGAETLSAADIVDVADVDAGRLKFVPLADENGSPYDSFTFRVGDGEESSAVAANMTIDVTPINDAPGITVGAGDSAAEMLTETNTTLAVSGTLTVEDVDITDTVNASFITVSESGDGTGVVANGASLAMMSVGANPVIDGSSTTGVID